MCSRAQRAGLQNRRHPQAGHLTGHILFLLYDAARAGKKSPRAMAGPASPIGYSDIGITLKVYSHVIPGMQEDVAKRLDASLRLVLENDA